MTRRIIPILIALMGFIHIGATFSPLISGKLGALDTNTYHAMIYMSLMCGLTQSFCMGDSDTMYY